MFRASKFIESAKEKKLEPQKQLANLYTLVNVSFLELEEVIGFNVSLLWG